MEFIKKIDCFFKSNQKKILSLFILVFVILVLGLPFYNWGFLHDDFGVVWHSKIKYWKDLLYFFNEPGMTSVVQPSNYNLPEQSFFVVYYRPVVYIVYAIQMFIFKFSAYGYFLTTIFLHALNSVLIFNIFTFFTNFTLAFWGAMFFAFHPSLSGWLGWIAGQAHVFNFLLILLVFLFLKKYLDTKKIYFYLISCFVFLISLFTRETAVILTVWFPFAIYLYVDYRGWRFKNHLRKIWYSLKITFVYWILTIFYFVVRISLYPIITHGKLQIELNPMRFILSFKERFFHLVTLMSDLAGLSFLPPGSRLLKGTLIILIFGFLFVFFLRNTKKKYILFFLGSMLIFMWPAILRYYASRYLYKSLFFYVLILLFFIQFSFLNKSFTSYKTKKIVLVFIYLLLTFNIILLFFSFKKREERLFKLNSAFSSLVSNKKVQNKALCFVGLPWSFFPTGVAQGVWINGISSDLPVYYDRRTWGFSNLPVFKNWLKIDVIKNGFRLRSLNSNDLHIAAGGQEEFAMGDLTINKRSDGKPIDVSLIFDKKYLKQDILFVSWDYEEFKFKILGSKKDLWRGINK